jgi:soluble lytic murein transglycosylase-like protein
MRAVSSANAIGVMQVIPSTGEWISTIVGRNLNLLDPQDNVTAGVALLNYLTRNGRDLNKAIAGYYQGESAVNTYGIYDSTWPYVTSVRSLMKQF